MKRFVKKCIVIVVLTMFFINNSATYVNALNKIVVTNANNDIVFSSFILNSDITKLLKEIFDDCNKADSKLIIYIPSGDYIVSSEIELISNISIIMDENVNIMLDNNSLFVSSSGNRKYYGTSNVYIFGGRIYSKSKDCRSFIRLAHCKNIRIENVYLSNSSNHFIEFAAAKNIVINNCTFSNKNSYITSDCEAVQMDILEEMTHFKNMPPYDLTMNKNITISNCIFSNLSCGLGSHSMFLGHYQQNIVIKNNHFTNIKYNAIVLYGSKDVKILNNTIFYCDKAISFNSIKKDLSKICISDNQFSICRDFNTAISGNIIYFCKKGVELYGTNTESYQFPLSNIRVSDNIITHSNQSFILSNISNCKFKNNQIIN